MLNLAVNARDAMPDGRHAHHRDARTSSSTTSVRRRATRRVAPGRYVAAGGQRHRLGMDAETQARDLRAVLHHQGAGQGHRPRAGDGLRHRQAERRLHLASTASPGHGTTLQDLPAAGRGRRRERRRTARRPRRAGGTETILLVEDEPARARARRRACCGARLHGARGRATATRRCAVRPAARRPDRPAAHRRGDAGDERPELAERAAARCARGLKVLFMSGYTDDAVLRHGMLDAGHRSCRSRSRRQPGPQGARGARHARACQGAVVVPPNVPMSEASPRWPPTRTPACRRPCLDGAVQLVQSRRACVEHDLMPHHSSNTMSQAHITPPRIAGMVARRSCWTRARRNWTGSTAP